MLKSAIVRLSLGLLGCIAVIIAIAEPARAVMAAGSSCGDSVAFSPLIGVASLGNDGSTAAATAQEPGSAGGCQGASGSCDGSPCSSVTCTFTMNDTTVRGESYTVSPPISPACAAAFCQKKCQ
jgi:hypothetical protein